MKKYNLLKVLAITVLVAWLLTLIIPGSYIGYDGKMTTDGVNSVGIFGLISNLSISITYFSSLAILLVSTACFYAVVNKTKTYANFIEKVSAFFDNKKGAFITLTVLFFGILSLFVSDFLMLIVFVPFFLKVMEKLSIDKEVQLASTLVAALIGSMCGIYNSTLFNALSIGINTLLLVKIILFVISTLVLLFLIVPRRNKKIKTEVKAEVKKEEKVETKVEKEVKPVAKKAPVKKTAAKKAPAKKAPAKKTTSKTKSKGKKVAK